MWLLRGVRPSEVWLPEVREEEALVMPLEGVKLVCPKCGSGNTDWWMRNCGKVDCRCFECKHEWVEDWRK